MGRINHKELLAWAAPRLHALLARQVFPNANEKTTGSITEPREHRPSIEQSSRKRSTMEFNRSIRPMTWLLVLVAGTMPFWNLVNSYAILALSVGWAIHAFLGRWNPGNLRVRAPEWIFPAIYCLCATVAFFADQSPLRSAIYLETYTSLLLFPLFLGSIQLLNPSELRLTMLGFVAGNLLGSLVCLLMAGLDFLRSHHVNALFYHRLSGHIGINAVYFSMYVLFCLFVLLHYFFFTRVNAKVRGIALLMIFYFILLEVMLSSKMFLFLLFLSGLCLTAYSFFILGRKRLSILFLVLFLITLPATLLKFPYSKSRIEYTQLKRYEGSMDNNNGIAVRYVLWRASWDLLQRNQAFLGLGHFTAQDSLRKEYRDAGFEVAAREGYNSHNQYLFTWLSYGYLGIVSLLTCLIYPFLASWRRRNLLGICLAACFILGCLTECMLETQKGIVFFSFFSSLLAFHLRSNGLTLRRD